jgi:hypothetical protein
MFGVPSSKIVEVKNPYRPVEILNKYDETATAFITVVGEKDASRLGGNYFKKWKNGIELEPYLASGYVYVSPAQSNPISGTDVRNNLGKNVDDNTKMDFFSKRAYPKFDKKIYTLITKKLSESYKPIHIRKEVIEEWVITQFPQFMIEVSQGLGLPTGEDVDDGPNFFFPNYDVFNGVSEKRAQQIGYTLFKQIMDKKYEDYYEHPIYPKGPVKAVTPFPAGVIGKTTATNQKDFTTSRAYDLWFKHVTRAMALAGYSLVRDKDEIEKRLSTKDLTSYDTMLTKKDPVVTGNMVNEVAPHGYPDQKWIDDHNKELKRLRKKFDKEPKEKYYEPALGGGITEDIVRLNNSLGINRDVLPQIDKDELENYLEYLGSYHIPFQIEFQPISSLNSSQEKIDTDKVKDIMKNEDEINTPIIVSKDDYILDGHHRALAAFNLDRENEIPVVKVDLSLDELIHISNDFSGSYNQSINENIIGLIFGVVGSAIARVFGRIIVDVIINTAINSASIVIEKLKMLVKPEDYIKFLKKIQNNKQFNQELLDLLTKRKDLTNFSKIATEIVKLPTFNKELDVFVKSNNLSKDKVEILRNTIEYVFARGISRNKQSIIDAVKRKFPDLKESSSIGGLGSGNNSARWTPPGKSKKLTFAQLSGYTQNDFPIADILDIPDEKFGEITTSNTAKYINRRKASRNATGELVFENNKSINEIPMADLVKIDTYADKQLNPVDVVLTDKHFFDRLQDPRNKKDISPAELIGFFKRLAKNKNKFVEFLNQYGQIVAKDNRSKINIPFMKQANKVIAKTIMRKDDFKTSSPKYTFEDINLPVNVGDTILTGRFKNKKVVVKTIGKDEHGMPTINGKKVVNFRMVNEGLLTEGGAYGHMNHPFDNEINLTFGQLKDIVNRALDGELELTREKTDGQALAISWVNGKLVAARNKGHLANKGAAALDIKGVATKFSGRGELEKAYNFAMNDLSKAIKSLSEKQREKIFKDGACFMNLEVIYPTSVNVIPYGQALLVFHGTMEYDEAGNAIGENQQAARILAGMIKQVNQDVQKNYTIQGPPVTKLPKSQNLSSLKGKYNAQIQKLQSKFGLSDNAGISEYHQAWWTDFIQKKSPVALDNTTLMGLVKRWAFFDKSFRLDAKNITDVKVLDWAKGIDKNDHAKIAKDNIRPFEDIFLGVGSDVLSFMSSVLTANPDGAIRAIKDRLDKTIADVQKGGDPKKIDKLKLELERLNAIGGKEKIVPNEGIVFVYGGNTLKLTGTFASVNQILGLMYSP